MKDYLFGINKKHMNEFYRWRHNYIVHKYEDVDNRLIMTESSGSKLFNIDTQHKEWIMLGLSSKIKSLDFSMWHEEMGCTRTGRYSQNNIPYEIYLDTGSWTIRN